MMSRVCSAVVTAEAATWDAPEAFLAISLMLALISSAAAATSWMFCSTCDAELRVASVRSWVVFAFLLSSWLVEESSSAAAPTEDALSAMVVMLPRKPWKRSWRLVAMRPTASSSERSISRVRSPLFAATTA